VTGARVTDDGAHLCVQVEQGDPVHTHADEFAYEVWHLVVDLASGQLTRRACPSPPLLSFDMQRPIDDPRATLTTEPSVALVQEEARCGVLLGEAFLPLVLPWGRHINGCQLSLQAPFGSGRYLPVYAFKGMDDGREFDAALYLVDLTTQALALVPDGTAGAAANLGLDARAFGPHPGLTDSVTILQRLDLAQDRADGLPWRRSESVDVFYTDGALIDLRHTPPRRVPLPRLG
jgi:hypothetical protein